MQRSNQEKKSKNMTPYNWCGYMWSGVQSALETNNYKDQTRLAVSTNADKEINNLLHETPMFSAFCEDTYSRISLSYWVGFIAICRDMPTAYLSYLPQEHVVIAWCGSKCVKIDLLDLVILVSQARFKLWNPITESFLSSHRTHACDHPVNLPRKKIMACSRRANSSIAFIISQGIILAVMNNTMILLLLLLRGILIYIGWHPHHP